jgi:predicted DNA binding protein
MSIELVLIPVGIAVAQSVASRIEKHNNHDQTFTIKTVMKRQHLLQKAIEQYGCKVNELNLKNYEAEIGDTKIYFQQDDQEVFEAVFNKSVDSNDAVEFIENLHTEYKYLIQQETYQMLIEKAENKGLILESEEISEDRSILLTFNVSKING